MNTTSTIRNLKVLVKQTQRMQAASHKHSTGTEAHAILTRAIPQSAANRRYVQGLIIDASNNAVESVHGLWQGCGRPDEMMHDGGNQSRCAADLPETPRFAVKDF